MVHWMLQKKSRSQVSPIDICAWYGCFFGKKKGWGFWKGLEMTNKLILRLNILDVFLKCDSCVSRNNAVSCYDKWAD